MKVVLALKSLLNNNNNKKMIVMQKGKVAI